MNFDDAFRVLPATGWLTEAEARLLWDSVNQTDGLILEVGCYHGRSTCLLAATGRHVICVDPWAEFDSNLVGDDIFHLFCRNLEERGYRNSVFVNRVRIEDWSFHHNVGFAYLDGDHTYDGTIAQIEKALAYSGDIIAIHDVNDSGGGLEVKMAALELLGPWDTRVERLAVWKR